MLAYKRKVNKPLTLLIFGVIIITILICMYIFRDKHIEGVFPTQIDNIPVHTVLLDENLDNRPSIKRQIKYIVIHETANFNSGANARSHSDFLIKGGNGDTAWHYTVDDTEIYHHIPDDEVAWHAGDKLKENGGNLCGVGIELCVNPDGDFESTFDNAAKLTAYLLKSYRLKISAVKQHGDFVSKNCPQTIRKNNRWQEFLNRVSSYK